MTQERRGRKWDEAKKVGEGSGYRRGWEGDFEEEVMEGHMHTRVHVLSRGIEIFQ